MELSSRWCPPVKIWSDHGVDGSGGHGVVLSDGALRLDDRSVRRRVPSTGTEWPVAAIYTKKGNWDTGILVVVLCQLSIDSSNSPLPMLSLPSPQPYMMPASPWDPSATLTIEVDFDMLVIVSCVLPTPKVSGSSPMTAYSSRYHAARRSMPSLNATFGS